MSVGDCIKLSCDSQIDELSVTPVDFPPVTPEQLDITFEEFDAFMERAAQIELYGLQPYWPTPTDIKEKGANFTVKQLALMFSWLMEMNPDPVTDEERTSYNAMKEYVYTHIHFVEEYTNKEA